MFGMGLSFGASSAAGFLHWRGVRPAKVLFIDGEMSRRLLKKRISEETARFGSHPAGLHFFSAEDVENFAPLNTKQGQAIIENVIKQIGSIDLIIFDNVMSLIAGVMKEEEAWGQTISWIRSLTRRSIGQLWLHHTGHDESRGYGTKTREWQMDAVLHLEKIERPDTDVSFQSSFRKARERTPETRNDFADMQIALVNNRWIWNSIDGAPKLKVSPIAEKFFEALCDACDQRYLDCPAASLDVWRAECSKRGLLDREKPDSVRAMFSKQRLALIAANRIACNETMAWIPSRRASAETMRDSTLTVPVK